MLKNLIHKIKNLLIQNYKYEKEFVLIFKQLLAIRFRIIALKRNKGNYLILTDNSKKNENDFEEEDNNYPVIKNEENEMQQYIN